jgi:hypothetical protein
VPVIKKETVWAKGRWGHSYVPKMNKEVPLDILGKIKRRAKESNHEKSTTKWREKEGKIGAEREKRNSEFANQG